MRLTLHQTNDDASNATPRVILMLVVLATALSNVEVGLVNVALPSLADAFQVGPSTIGWVAIAYQLAIIGTLVLFGRLVDVLGGRTLYLAGMATVTVASVLAAMSLNALWLILARGLLGLGAAMLLATSQALLAIAYPRERRGRALGFMHMAVAGGLMSGPAIGGLLITFAGWRLIFLAPALLAGAALIVAAVTLPVAGHRSREPIDATGAFLIVIVATLGVAAMMQLTQHGWNTLSVAVLGITLFAAVLVVAVESRQAAPLVDLRLLTRWNLSAGLVVAFLTFIALAANMFLIPFALQDVMGHPAGVAGLVMMVVPLAILPVAPVAGGLADRFGVRPPTRAGLIAISVAIVGMAQFQPATPLWYAVTVLVVYGIGAGVFQAPNNSSVLSAAPDGREGTVSGMLAMSRNLGQVMGVTVASMVWAWRENHYATRAAPQVDPQVAGLRDAFLVLAGFAVLALALSLLRRNQ